MKPTALGSPWDPVIVAFLKVLIGIPEPKKCNNHSSDYWEGGKKNKLQKLNHLTLVIGVFFF